MTGLNLAAGDTARGRVDSDFVVGVSCRPPSRAPFLSRVDLSRSPARWPRDCCRFVSDPDSSSNGGRDYGPTNGSSRGLPRLFGRPVFHLSVRRIFCADPEAAGWTFLRARYASPRESPLRSLQVRRHRRQFEDRFDRPLMVSTASTKQVGADSQGLSPCHSALMVPGVVWGR